MQENSLDFFFDFTPIAKNGSVRVTHFRGNTAPVLYSVKMRDEDFSRRALFEFTPEATDVADLAVAVHVADRITTRSENRRYNIFVQLPVRRPDHLNQRAISDALMQTLDWFTGDIWEFNFVQREHIQRIAEAQPALPHVNNELEVSLWSGGLDALAGVCQRASISPDIRYVLVGTGANSQIYAKQKEVFDAMARVVDWKLTLLRPRFKVKRISTALPDHPQMRSRGFVFLAIGCVAAYLYGQKRLYIHENGIGALNLPFRRSEIGLDHARSVHPRSLTYVSQLIGLILDTPFDIVNPFLFDTKARMCQIFQENHLSELPHTTVSCDRRDRTTGEHKQCGRCSSCILRQISLRLNGIAEGEDEYVYGYFDPNWSSGLRHQEDHLPAVLQQVDTLQTCLSSEHPWDSLIAEYPTLLIDVVNHLAAEANMERESIIVQLTGLLSDYVNEWNELRANHP